MVEKKPKVFPSLEEGGESVEKINYDLIGEANDTGNKIKQQIVEENPIISEGERKAAQEMLERTTKELAIREGRLQAAIDNAESNDVHRAEIMRTAEIQRKNRDGMFKQKPTTTTTPPVQPPIPPSYDDLGDDSDGLSEEYVKHLSQAQMDAPYDMIPLPSGGKLYKNVKSNIRVAYLNASDENLLTSPHILESDEFLEILLNRKILEPNLRYKDLHIGDRNAIMVWLRATAYGTDYPITILDELGKPFEINFDLTELKTKKLGAEPDGDNYFLYKLPSNEQNVKFKLLSTEEVDELEGRLEHESKVQKLLVNNTVTHTLQRHIVSVDGESDSEKLKTTIGYMRSSDRKSLMDYIDSIESGLDLEINVSTPSRGSVTTLLPLNLNFFWPDYRI